jgi:trans-2,3-dihydro-3-hydroxyanthranilate isomerase
VCFAGVIKHFDTLPDGSHRRLIEQGYEMERPSQIALTMEVDQGKLGNVRIGGHAVRVSEGKLTL